MALLFTANLQPQGPSGLAAIRFNHPTRISTIRIFPHGVPIFESTQHIRSLTQPDAFYLDVFFNAQPLVPESKDRQHAVNALVPTSISYSGGLMDFAVDMGIEYATRLMIVKGSFDQLSLAIYGQIIADTPPVRQYEPKIITPLEPEPLAAHLNPAHCASDPTALAKSLLNIIPNAPSLALAIRLMFCLKPTETDWDNPDFPHIYANLDNDSEDYDLDSILSKLDRPIAENVGQESLDRFVERLIDFVGPPSIDQAYQLANVLNLSASQSPLFSNALLSALDLPAIFTTATLTDIPTLTALTDACSNALIARHFATQTPLLTSLTEIRNNTRLSSDKPLLAAWDRLETRILGWKAFEDSLSGPPSSGQADLWSRAAELVYDVCREEQTLGNWLASMIMHDDILSKLNQTLPSEQSPPKTPPVLFGRDEDDEDECDPITHADFIAFVRACVGVATVLGVLAWADSVGNDDCRERTLAVIHLWQSVDGYREIVNHLFLLRQLTRRLNWMTAGNNPPRHSGLLAERILCSLLLPPVPSSHPLSSSQTFQHAALPALSPDLTETVLALKQPLAFIPEHERLGFRKLALVVDDGLPAAVEELVVVFDSHQSHRAQYANDGIGRPPLSLRRVRILRVGVGLVMRELVRECDSFGGGRGKGGGGSRGRGGEGEKEWLGEPGGEWKVLETFGLERTFGFVEKLVDLFGDLVEDLLPHFSASVDFLAGVSSTSAAATSASAFGTGNAGMNDSRDLVEQLFATARELLVLIHRLVHPHPYPHDHPTTTPSSGAFSLTARGLRKIVNGIVDLVTCVDSVLPTATTTTTQQNGGRRRKYTNLQLVSRKTRKTCIRILRSFVRGGKESLVIEPRKRCVEEVVLRSLLMCGQEVGMAAAEGEGGSQRRGGGGGEDVVARVGRVLELIECVLPLSPPFTGVESSLPSSGEVEVDVDDQMHVQDDSTPSLQPDLQEQQELKRLKSHWAHTVFPLVFHELRLFMRVLPAEEQVRFLLVLVDVDENGEVGVGEWLVEEELKEVGEILRRLAGDYGHGMVGFDDDGGGGGEEEEVTVVDEVGEVDTMEGVEEEKAEKDKAEEEKEKEKEREKFVEEQRKREMLLRRRVRDLRRAEQMVSLYRVYVGVQFVWLLAGSSSPSASSWFIKALVQTPTLEMHLVSFLTSLLDAHCTTTPLTSLFKFFSQPSVFGNLNNDMLKTVVLLGMLRIASGDVTSVSVVGDWVVGMMKDEAVKRVLLGGGSGLSGHGEQDVDVLRLEVGRLCARCAERTDAISPQITEMVVGVLQSMIVRLLEITEGNTTTTQSSGLGKLKVLRGVTQDAFGVMCNSFIGILPEKAQIIENIRSTFRFDENEDFIPIPIELPDQLVLSLSNISALLVQSRNIISHAHTRDRSASLSAFTFSGNGVGVGVGGRGERPSTPKGTKTPDILGTIISPPTALLRSPAATGLTKTYANNDFRSLRQVPSARLNTSRLPSMHVDDFESGSASGPGPTAPGASMSPLIVPVPIPLGDASAFGGLLNMGQ